MESEQKYKITIKPFSGGKFIHVYESNPEFGYVVLESDELYFDESIHGLEFLKTNGDKSKLPKRQALLRGSIKRLEQFVEVISKKNLSGRIRITEYLEHEIPEDVKKANIRDDIPYEQAIKPFIKKYQHKIKSFRKEEIVHIELRCNGQRILHFQNLDLKYDKDILICKYDSATKHKLNNLLLEPLTNMRITTIEELEAQEQERQKKKIKQAEEIGKRKEEDTKENTISQNTERSLASVKRENAVMVPLIAMLVLGAIVALIMLPSLFTAVSVIVGSLIIFYFAGAFYQALFTKPVEFDLLRTILIGVAVILVIGAIMVINELTKTPHDPDMWRHP